MPVVDIIKKKIGRELAEWIFLGVRTGMRRAVADFRSAADPVTAERHIKRAIDLPHRSRARINEAITRYGLPALTDALALNGVVTVNELNVELTTLEAYTQTLYDRRINTAESWESLASDIEANVELESERWTFNLPAGYTDIWGE